MDQLVLRTYGKAFFELALELDEIELYEKQARHIIQVLNSDEELIKIIFHPEISIKNKMDILKNIFGNSISNSFLGLFEVIFRKNREENLIYIIDDFLNKVSNYKGIVKAEVVSSKNLDDLQLEKIRSNISKKLNKKVILEVSVDTSLIAGLKIKIDGCIIDGSIKKQIDDIKKILYNVKIC